MYPILVPLYSIEYFAFVQPSTSLGRSLYSFLINPRTIPFGISRYGLQKLSIFLTVAGMINFFTGLPAKFVLLKYVTFSGTVKVVFLTEAATKRPDFLLYTQSFVSA